MTVIKFHLLKFDKALLFQIVEQFDFSINSRVRTKLLHDNYPLPSQYLGSIDKSNILYNDPENRIIIKSVNSPELRINYQLSNLQIYLQGVDRSQNQKVMRRLYDTNEEMEKDYNLILDTLIKFSEKTKLAISQCL